LFFYINLSQFHVLESNNNLVHFRPNITNNVFQLSSNPDRNVQLVYHFSYPNYLEKNYILKIIILLYYNYYIIIIKNNMLYLNINIS